MTEALQTQLPETFSWLNAWAYAITRPTVTVYQKLVNDPLACTRRACAYTAAGAAAGFITSSFLQTILITRATGEFDLSLPAYTFSSSVMCGLPFAILAGILALFVSSGILQRVAGLLGGAGGFSKMAYASACFAAPIGMIAGIFSSGPVILEVVLPLLVYAVLLQVVAVKAVNGFHWGKAVLTLLIPLVSLALVAGAVALFA